MKLWSALAFAFLATQAVASAQQAPAERGAIQLAYPYPSPDETRVVFQGNFDGRWQLYELTLETNAVRRLHVSAHDDTHPSWSPDGQRVAFISNRDGNDEVYVLDLASGEARVVAPHPGKDGHPKWSADGQWLVFNRTFDPTDRGGDRDSAIMRMRSDGSDLRVISDNANIETFATLSPDGRSVAIVEWMPRGEGQRALGDIVVIDIASGRRRNLTNSPDVFDGYAYWGASGEWIYFSSVAQGNVALRRVRPRDGFIQALRTPSDGGEVRAIPDAREERVFYNVGLGQGRQALFVERFDVAPAS